MSRQSAKNFNELKEVDKLYEAMMQTARNLRAKGMLLAVTDSELEILFGALLEQGESIQQFGPVAQVLGESLASDVQVKSLVGELARLNHLRGS